MDGAVRAGEPRRAHAEALLALALAGAAIEAEKTMDVFVLAALPVEAGEAHTPATNQPNSVTITINNRTLSLLLFKSIRALRTVLSLVLLFTLLVRIGTRR